MMMTEKPHPLLKHLSNAIFTIWYNCPDLLNPNLLSKVFDVGVNTIYVSMKEFYDFPWISVESLTSDDFLLNNLIFESRYPKEDLEDILKARAYWYSDISYREINNFYEKNIREYYD